jgi:hypothetical protein
MNVRGQTNKQWMVETLRLVLRDAESGGFVAGYARVSIEAIEEVRAVLAEVDRPKRPKE